MYGLGPTDLIIPHFGYFTQTKLWKNTRSNHLTNLAHFNSSITPSPNNRSTAWRNSSL